VKVQPLYLIDDVFGELDHQRRNAMLKAIPNDAQKFITTTHSDWMNEGMLAEIPVHEVDGGTVKPL